MSMNHADILGIAIEPAMLKALNCRLKKANSPTVPSFSTQNRLSIIADVNKSASNSDIAIEKDISDKYGHLVQEESIQPIEVTHADISIIGTTTDTAYLHIELIIDGNEFSPLILDVNLEDSVCNSSYSFNKDFTNLDQHARKIITAYFTELASWISLTGSVTSINDAMLATLNFKLKSALEKENIRLTGMQIYPLSIAHSLQEEMTSAHNVLKLFVHIPHAKLGYQFSNVRTASYICDQYYDLYDLIDDHFCGELMGSLSYHAKAQIIKLFTELSNLYEFDGTFSALVSMV